jgi:asparagine synthase (glutamine-hydrolysing)
VRYVAFLRNAHSSSAELIVRQFAHLFRLAHPEWIFLTENNGISLFHLPFLGRSATVMELHRGHGVILGTLFPKDLNVSPRDWSPLIDEHLTMEIVRTKGRQLVSQFWGRYVGFLSNQDGTTHYVLRDCSGMIPCYTITHGESTIVFSNLEDISGLPIHAFSINPSYLA